MWSLQTKSLGEVKGGLGEPLHICQVLFDLQKITVSHKPAASSLVEDLVGITDPSTKAQAFS